MADLNWRALYDQQRIAAAQASKAAKEWQAKAEQWKEAAEALNDTVELERARAISEIARLRARIEALEGPPPVQPPVDPPPVDPPQPPQPPAPGYSLPAGNLDPATHRGSSSFDFRGLPFQVPPVPYYVIPTAEECDWILDGQHATGPLQHTIARRPDGNIIRDIYQRHEELGLPLPCRIGVRGNAGQATFGGIWGGGNSRSVVSKAGNPIRVEVVGLTDDSEIEAGWSKQNGWVEHLGLYNIGLRGAHDSFAMRCNDGIGTVVLDGVWFLRAKSMPGATGDVAIYASGLHFDQFERAVIANVRARGETPDSFPELFKEHVIYAKSSTEDGIWYLHNEMPGIGGGNRTWSQVRPGIEETTPFVGNVTYIGNKIEGLGWPHDTMPGDGDKGGGQALTCWQCPDGVVTFACNEITDSRYGCFGAMGQAPYRNALNVRGYPVKTVRMFGNTTTNQRGDRDALVISGVEELEVYDDCGGTPVVVDNDWGWGHHGIRTGVVRDFSGGTAAFRTYSPKVGRHIPVSVLELNQREKRSGVRRDPQGGGALIEAERGDLYA